jgi:hypothetical protein
VLRTSSAAVGGGASEDEDDDSDTAGNANAATSLRIATAGGGSAAVAVVSSSPSSHGNSLMGRAQQLHHGGSTDPDAPMVTPRDGATDDSRAFLYVPCLDLSCCSVDNATFHFGFLLSPSFRLASSGLIFEFSTCVDVGFLMLLCARYNLLRPELVISNETPLSSDS